MKRFALNLGAAALSTLIAAGSAFGQDVQTTERVIVTDSQDVKIVKTIKDGEVIVKAYVNGEEVDPDSLDLVQLREAGDDEEKSIIVRVLAEEEAHAHGAEEAKKKGKSELKIVIDGEEFVVGLDDVRRMLKEHGEHVGEHLGEHLELLKETDLAELKQHANLLLENVVRFAPETNTYTVQTELKSPPKVMIGITMDQVGPALASHLKLDPKNVTMIQSVLDGQPADRAGLQVYDIIVAVDGEHPISSGRLLELLQKHDPGDKLTFKIIRGGEPMAAVLELAPWNDEVMGSLSAVPQAEDGYNFRFFSPGEMPTEFSKEVQEKLQQAMGREKQIVIELQKQAEEHAKKAQELHDKIRVTAPKAMQWVQAGDEKHVDAELESRMQRLEERLERIEKLLEKLAN